MAEKKQQTLEVPVNLDGITLGIQSEDGNTSSSQKNQRNWSLLGLLGLIGSVVALVLVFIFGVVSFVGIYDNEDMITANKNEIQRVEKASAENDVKITQIASNFHSIAMKKIQTLEAEGKALWAYNGQQDSKIATAQATADNAATAADKAMAKSRKALRDSWLNKKKANAKNVELEAKLQGMRGSIELSGPGLRVRTTGAFITGCAKLGPNGDCAMLKIVR